ncbi:antitermination protein N [Pantoea sp. 3_1284]|uniref:antitermination protein N n=1 Tax=Pantoea sp. 3_1284 TaxID=2259618 RepID=UPI000DE48C25|nr:antitermination protein N [Pantoea sp. 3_1284]RBO14316.1 transcriptional regulator [Pantoea sp. 3_1284]
MNSQEKRRERRKLKQQEWKKENPTLVGIKATPDDTHKVNLVHEAQDRVEKALSASLPRDHEKQEDIPHEDVMYRVVNHAHARDGKKKW